MALAHSPRIVTDGLVLCLDAGNPTKGLNLSQNYFPYSEDITTQTGGWTNTQGNGNDYGGTGIQAVTTANYGIAPDGTQTADRIQLDKGVGTGTTDRSGMRYALSMVDRTLSYHIKFLDDTTITGFVTSVYPQGATFTYDTLSNDWYRVKISGSGSVTCRIQYSGSTTVKNTLDALIWGIQLEDGSNATDYVKTTGTSKTNSRALNDLSGNSGIGTLINGVGYTSSNGGYLTFNGTDNYVNVSNSPSLQITNNLSICLWVNVNGAQSGKGVIVKGPTGADYDYMFYLTSNSTIWSLYKKDASNVVGLVTGFTGGTHIDTWKHMVVTKNDTSCIHYENGVQVSSGSFANSEIRTSNNNFRIGFGWSSYFNGSIPSVQIYNKALTAAEVQQNFNATRGRFNI